jgi:multiple sugar transport system permease protein
MQKQNTPRVFETTVENAVLEDVVPQPKPAKRSSLRRNETLAAYALIAPNLIIYFVFVVLPVIASLVLSFTDWNFAAGLKSLHFVGLENYLELPSDEWVTDSLRNNFTFTLGVPVSMTFGLLFAVLLNRFCYLRGALRSLIFMPYITSSIAIAIVWMVIFHPTYGPINGLLISLGIDNPPRWMGSSQWALPTIMFVTIWAGLGYNMVIYLAGLQGIPQELYEASEIDGAGPLSQFRFITFPLLAPTSFFLLITGIIGSFKAFDLINVMTQGGPGTATTMLAFSVYRYGFVYYRMGYASSIAWVLMIIVFIITLIQWWGQNKVAYDL